MSSGSVIRKLVIFLFISNLRRCYSSIHDRAEVVTYGEPCVTSRQLPIRIEGQRAFVREEKIPVSLNFRAISDMYTVPPRHVEYPITILTPRITYTAASLSEQNNQEDPLRGKFYTYNTYVLPAVHLSALTKNYNFAVDVPISSQQIVTEQLEEKCVPRLKGLTSRVDRILVPACQISSFDQ
ncbi:uncharacterized protein LOC143180914 [Calliopsis andreniformis]|uniref:uncharacterized protein LOC143180914 n=1 Tax=Calliopsis andreniformis TaxID=337506 RepID=UPI003FCD2631